MQAPHACPACFATPRAFGPVQGVPLLACGRCRLQWWHWPRFEPAELYDESYFQSDQVAHGYSDYAALEPGLRRTARTRLRHLQRLGAVGGRLLDVGCGTGVFLDEARSSGWEVQGLEPSPFASQVARDRGLNVETGTLDSQQSLSGLYDCITLWDCIEHLPAPRETLLTLTEHLRPGGVMALSTGDVTSLCARWSGPRWHLYNFPEHLFFFSPQSLRLLLQQASCRVRTIRREVNWVTSGYIVERLRKTLLRQAPSGGSGGMLLPATLGDVLGVYAVRQERR